MVNEEATIASQRRARYKDFIIPFGKYFGEFLADVLIEDPNYVEWLAECLVEGSDAREAAVWHLEERENKCF